MMQTYYHRILQWLSWLLAVAALVYLIYRLITYDDYAHLVDLLVRASGVQYLALCAVLLLVPVQLMVEVCRWKYMLRGWRTISFRQSWEQVLLGQVAGFITPYRAGDIPARLVAAGLDIGKEEWKYRWHMWLKDTRKWLAVVWFTIVRYMVWGLQLWSALFTVGVVLTPLQAVVCIVSYYVVVSVMPVLPVADIPLKGGWAVMIFGQYSDNVVAIVLAVSIIWICNTILPVLFGSMKKILYFCTQEKK